ncbi:uncharacterized protein LOC127926668 [Oncorhynchus keta]|uniref:uncharacterized protein LOC127926668 n=1 Tax=Oncorhynchus keta TaxID=8018 RepID=UPI00227C88A7|nr:uncharacterized protein LOC127926668 [Oncorhynchus keta]
MSFIHLDRPDCPEAHRPEAHHPDRKLTARKLITRTGSSPPVHCGHVAMVTRVTKNMSAKAKQSNKSADKNANDRNDVASKESDAEKANPQWKLISHEQINTLLDLTVEQVQFQFEEILGLKNYQTCLKEASLLDYFVSGFWWTREMNYTCQQISFIMALLQFLLDNISEKQMPFVDNLNEFAKMISGTRQSPSPEVDSLFDAEQAMSITDYLKCSLFQNYQLYEFLFSQPREELLLGKKVRLPASLCPYVC